MAVAPLQKLPKGSATATIGYEIGDEEVDLDTGDVDMEADHNTRDADLNENFGRSQAVTKLGRERMKIVFPKQKQGEFTPKIVPVAKTYSKFDSFTIADIFTKYVKSLLLRTVELCTHEDNRPPLPTAPSPLVSQHEHPDKDTIPLFSRYPQ